MTCRDHVNEIPGNSNWHIVTRIVILCQIVNYKEMLYKTYNLKNKVVSTRDSSLYFEEIAVFGKC